MSTLWGFGDSWGAGYGIDPAMCYTQLIGDGMGIRVNNQSQAGAALGHIVHDFLNCTQNFQPGDLVLVTLPPDTRGYRIYPGHAGTLFSGTPEYEQMMQHVDYSLTWFEWHHSLFQSTIINQCQEKQVTLLMQHNYGELRIIEPLQQTCNPDYYVDQTTSMSEWLGGMPWDGYTTENCGPSAETMCSDLFLDNDTHPNEQGHAIIAKRITERYYEILNQ